MASLDRPRLRPLSFSRLEHEGAEFVAMEDSLGVVPAPVLVPRAGFQWVVRHFDGTASLVEIQARILRETAQRIPMAELAGPGRAPRPARWCSTGRRSPPSSTPIAGSASARRPWRAARTPRPSGPSGRSWPGSSRIERGPVHPETDGEPTAATLRGIVSPAHRLRTRRPGLHLGVQGAGRGLGRRHVRHPRGRAPVLPQPLRPDQEGFRDAAGPGPDRPRVRRPDRRPGRRRPLRRRAGAPDRALDRVPGRLPPVPAGRAAGLLDRADPGRLVPRPDGSGDRPDPG